MNDLIHQVLSSDNIIGFRRFFIVYDYVAAGPSSQPATVNINLTNPATKWVAFKVKTTAPKRYCVRPNGGFIKAGDNVNVSIVYQPGEVNDPQERARHKFLVQAIFVDNDQVQLDQVVLTTVLVPFCEKGNMTYTD